MNKTRIDHLKSNFIDEELTLYRNDFERKGEMEFEYSPFTLLCRGGSEGFVLSDSLVSVG